MDYPQNLIEQYLKASHKLKKFDRIVFKRFAPNVSEVLDEFSRLAIKFEEGNIYQYAAMCHLGVAKCEMSNGNTISECQAYLRAARCFLHAHNAIESLQLRSNGTEYKEGALRCYTHAVERCADDSVIKAAIIREMSPLQPYYNGTSSFVSPAHCIHELEVAAHIHLERRDFFGALQQLDDIVDNISERRQHRLYEDLLRSVEVLRLLLLIVLNLPPTRQSPSHIKLVEYYLKLGNFELTMKDQSGTGSNSGTNINDNSPGTFVPQQMRFVLSEICVLWHERKMADLKMLLEEFNLEFKSLNDAHRFVLKCICENIDKNC